ncbi:amidohydrolase family protein [Kutzneria sp. CA-103260]|uniref:amidohydrolase family protein n=1 Tax=Kutzneria sp. CA-103260 TaxID=2802641 RepID=UPI001BF0A149|nr:amidohydrolase family protein [Kutzneria sp. CA-103260]QUQ70186.1 amidohydrolase [Kutzneria sp. CA-103260]
MNISKSAGSDQLWGLRATRLFDGERFHPGSPLVLFRGNTIEAVDLSGADPADSIPVEDLGDATILPGLVDAHTHLAFDPAQDAFHQVQADDDAALLARMRRHAQQALRAGITTLRDLGDRNYLALDLRDQFTADASGPEILVAGPPITPTRGHCWFLGGEADGLDGVTAAARERIARGVDAVKIMATGGATTPGTALHESQYTLAELRAVVEVAHQAGTLVTAHAHGGGGIADAVAAGADGIEHGFFLTGDTPRRAEPDWATVAALAERGVFVGTTTARRPPAEPVQGTTLRVRTNFARMHREGVKLVCSSDAGVGPLKTHDCLPYGILEFSTLLEHTNTEALVAATSLAAESCGVGGRKGRIAAGYDADVLVVAGDVQRDLTSILDVRAVYRAGALTSGVLDESTQTAGR